MNVAKVLCLSFTVCIISFLSSSSEAALQLGGNRGGSINELLAASLLGAVLGTATHRMKMQRQQQQEESSQQPKESVPQQHKVYRPWENQALPQNPMMGALHMLPSLNHHQMINPLSVPYYGDLTPLLLQLSREQIYSPMASQLVPSVFPNQGFPDISGLDDISALDTLQSLRILKNNPGGLVRAY